MLRNVIEFARAVRFVFLLNEVLSLNAQESHHIEARVYLARAQSSMKS